jgi:hypothetical protein
VTPLLAAAALLVGPSAPRTEVARDPAGPRLVVEPSRFDFGSALPGKRLTKEFSLRNMGSAPLRIEKLASSCACTAFLLDEKDRTLPPGRSAPLRVTLTTPARPGRVVETVSLTTNDGERAVTEISVEATVAERKAP